MSAPTHPNLRTCAYTKVDGSPCGGAAYTDSEYCRHHDNLKTSMASKVFHLPALDDPNSVQVATMQIMNALITGKVTRADATLATFFGRVAAVPILFPKLRIVAYRLMRRFHQQAAQHAIALLADRAQLLPSRRRMLARDQPQIAGPHAEPMALVWAGPK